MIFYFSGTGNSEWAARQLAEQLSQTLVSIADDMRTPSCHQLEADEPLGFVFPTYAWGLPLLVERFIQTADIRGVGYTFMLTTCGDDTGRTAQQFRTAAAARGWSDASCWALQMPESYVCLPGFEVDSAEKEDRKISTAKQRLDDIAAAIRERQRNVSDALPGSFAWVKSRMLRPVFNALLTSPKYFHTTDACISCGRCAQECPLHNIQMSTSSPSRPEWGSNCAMCLHCYHTCPTRAIRWGRMMEHKGQYLFQRRKKR